MFLLAQEAADKSVYIQASDDPIGQLFIAVIVVVAPVLAGVGVHRLFSHAYGWVPAVAVVIGWWLFLLVFVDIQSGNLVAE